MEYFGDMINEQRFVDIPMKNGTHTWNNRRGNTHKIALLLDRFLISEQEINRDISIEAMIFLGTGSDH